MMFSFNEPDNSGQSDIAPSEAAALWPTLETIASAYDLELVAPCVTNSNKGAHSPPTTPFSSQSHFSFCRPASHTPGRPWLEQFLGNC